MNKFLLSLLVTSAGTFLPVARASAQNVTHSANLVGTNTSQNMPSLTITDNQTHHLIQITPIRNIDELNKAGTLTNRDGGDKDNDQNTSYDLLRSNKADTTINGIVYERYYLESINNNLFTDEAAETNAQNTAKRILSGEGDHHDLSSQAEGRTDRLFLISKGRMTDVREVIGDDFGGDLGRGHRIPVKIKVII